MSMDLTPEVAKEIVNSVGSNGIPPECGFEYFTVGLEEYLKVIEEEYLSSFIKAGGSSFKMVVGGYGVGKTHFLYSIRKLAWKHNFVVSYVVLKPEETPFHKLELVYRAIVGGLTRPMSVEELRSGVERGIDKLIKYWYNCIYEYYEKRFQGPDLEEAIKYYARNNINGFENVTFTKAVREAFLRLQENDEDGFEEIIMWLKGEGYDRRRHGSYGILQKIDKSTAFPMIRSVAQWLRSIGYSGLVILFDEAEQVPSFNRKEMDLLLNNLRQLIDECHRSEFKGVMIFYAVPDEFFLERRGNVYVALKQRLATFFNTSNPSGVKINLEKIFENKPIDLLREIGIKLAEIYKRAYDVEFDSEALNKSIINIAKKAYEQRFGDVGYKRVFVQSMIEALRKMSLDPASELNEQIAEELIKGLTHRT